jgi:toxin ParE1/3/4
MKLRLSARAQSDVADIRSFVVARNPQGAERLREALLSDMDLLEQFPQSGRQTSIPHVRVLPVVRYPYLIYHTLVGDEIVVLHIRHASRSAPAVIDFD